MPDSLEHFGLTIATWKIVWNAVAFLGWAVFWLLVVHDVREAGR